MRYRTGEACLPRQSTRSLRAHGSAGSRASPYRSSHARPVVHFRARTRAGLRQHGGEREQRRRVRVHRLLRFALFERLCRRRETPSGRTRPHPATLRPGLRVRSGVARHRLDGAKPRGVRLGAPIPGLRLQRHGLRARGQGRGSGPFSPMRLGRAMPKRTLLGRKQRRRRRDRRLRHVHGSRRDWTALHGSVRRRRRVRVQRRGGNVRGRNPRWRRSPVRFLPGAMCLRPRVHRGAHLRGAWRGGGHLPVRSRLPVPARLPHPQRRIDVPESGSSRHRVLPGRTLCLGSGLRRQHVPMRDHHVGIRRPTLQRQRAVSRRRLPVRQQPGRRQLPGGRVRRAAVHGRLDLRHVRQLRRRRLPADAGRPVPLNRAPHRPVPVTYAFQ